jgi:heat shock protein HtpX
LASLAQLKVAMIVPILLVSVIFTGFLVVIMYILRLSFIWAFVLALIFILIQYLIGPTIVRASTRLRYLQAGENFWLESTVRDLAEKSGIPTPRLAIVPNSTPNAFVFGRTSGDATLALHEGLLRNLNQEEVRGVIGHELGHIRHKDFLVMTLLSAVPLLAYLISRGTFEAAWMSGRSRRRDKDGRLGGALLAVGVVSFVVYIISLLLVMQLSRLREHYADAYSAYVTEAPSQLESALTKITYGLSLSPTPPPGARTLYICDQALAMREFMNITSRKEEYDLDRDGVLDDKELEVAMEKEAKSRWLTINRWFQTHPSTFQRILLLREIESEMATGRYSERRVYANV